MSCGPHVAGCRFPLRLALPCLLAACAPGSADVDSAEGAAPRTELIASIPTHASRALVENSAAVISVTYPGTIFGINDSGHPPDLFALDSTGADRGTWRIRGARNIDWEAAAEAPCTADQGSVCLYIADVGDNGARRESVALYRVPVPAPLPREQTGVLDATRLEFRYADGPHNVEALAVTSRGDAFLITKDRQLRPDGSIRPTLVFELPASAWSQAMPAEARLVDSLPIYPGSAPGRLVTDAALSPDGRRLAVRTYTEVYVFTTDSASGRIVPGSTWHRCPLGRRLQPQGEGIGWWWDGRSLVLSSEGRDAPLLVLRCEDPADTRG